MNRQERLRQARESMDEAVLLAHEHMGNKMVLAKYYHAMMNCLFALFDIREIGRLTHEDIIGRFEQEYVKRGKGDAAVLGALRRAYDLTHECDCDNMPVPTEEDIASAQYAARSLVRTVYGTDSGEVTIHENSAV
jgi:uncharacterized protein (UPF0332 family)